MMQHEQDKGVGVHIEQKYVADTLGAPFKVVLLDGVTSSIDPKMGKEVVNITDVVGLIGAVVRSRVLHPRKLSGPEIKFIRDALSVRAAAVAKFLQMTAEHLSRCENGTKVMSAGSEKEFRLAAFLATRMEEPASLFVRSPEGQPEAECQLGDDAMNKALEFVKAFLSMKIEAVYAADAKPLEFAFTRKAKREVTGSTGCPDDKWKSAA